MKGRYIGVSLFIQSSQIKYNCEMKKSFPEDQISTSCFFVKSQRETPLCTCMRGSITVEAAVILPLFACFFSLLLFYFQIMKVEISVQSALEQTGRILAVYAEKEAYQEVDDLKYLSIAKGMVYSELREDTVIAQFVKGGALGISLLNSEFQGDYILLKANYVMKFPIKLFGGKDFWISQKTRLRKWTGWHSLSINSEEETVYVTMYGEVYHLRRSCPYLDLSIQKISAQELVSIRNANGGRYDECELCGMGIDLKESIYSKQELYITNYGDKYHFSVTCNGLKRSIFQIKLSQVGGMAGCRKCSK